MEHSGIEGKNNGENMFKDEINIVPHVKQFIYDKVDNKKRWELLRLLREENSSLKEAAEKLKINYSTAKTIIRVYRKEKRIFKKSSKNLDEFEEDYIKHQRDIPNSAPVNSAAVTPIVNPISFINSLNASTYSSSNENEDVNFIGNKIKRDFKICSIMLTEIYKDILINKRILDDLAYISSVINQNQINGS